MLHRVRSFAMRKTIGTITGVSTDKPVAALTFDDGPNPESTTRLLDILKKHNVKATFFMVGSLAHRHRELVKKVASGGHVIGNHTWDHVSLPLITTYQQKRQIRACQKAVAPYGQRLFRPPYGHQNLISRLELLRLGYKVITWNVASEDWLGYDADWITEKTMSKIRPGSIILFHDGLYTFTQERFLDRQPTLKAVDTILSRLNSRFNFITVTELLKQGRPRLQNWYYQENLQWLSNLKVATA